MHRCGANTRHYARLAPLHAQRFFSFYVSASVRLRVVHRGAIRSSQEGARQNGDDPRPRRAKWLTRLSHGYGRCSLSRQRAGAGPSGVLRFSRRGGDSLSVADEQLDHSAERLREEAGRDGGDGPRKLDPDLRDRRQDLLAGALSGGDAPVWGLHGAAATIAARWHRLCLGRSNAPGGDLQRRLRGDL